MAIVGYPLTATWLYDDSVSAYVNNTIEAQIEGGTAFPAMAEAADHQYYGFSRRIDALVFVLSTAGRYTGLKWEFGISVTSWTQFVPTHDYGFDEEKEYLRWSIVASDVDRTWVSFALTADNPHSSVSSVPDSTSRYWIRVSATAITTVAQVSSVLCRPYVSYASAADVQRQLQLNTAFTAGGTPISLETVEDFIRGAEDYLIYTTGTSWRLEFIEDELINFKQYGMKLRYEDIVDLYSISVYNGGVFEEKIAGRTQDLHVEPTLGMLYVSTIFLDAMPTNFRRSYSSRREQGAFKRAVKATYSWGKDIRTDKFGVQVGRIAVKQACIDIVTDLDFTPLIPHGLDTVSLSEKVQNWATDVENFVDRFSKLRVA